MITFNKDTGIFLLSGKSYSYCMCINRMGYLQTLHYGGRISEDSDFLLAHRDMFAPDPKNVNNDMSLGGMPGEVGMYGHGDYRESTVVIRRGDGARASRFRYAGHTVFFGVPELKGLPHVRSGGDTLCITLKDDFSDAELVLNYTVYPDSDVLVRNCVIKNTGSDTLFLEKAYSFCTELPSSDYCITRYFGSWSAERTPASSPLSYGVTRIQSTCGASSHRLNPFVCVYRPDCDENNGVCYGAALVYSGSFAITCELDTNDSLRIQGGVQDADFCWRLAAGESFVAPQALLCCSCNGFGDMSRSYADFLRQRLIDPAHVYKRRPIVINNWEGTYFDFNTQKLFDIIDKAPAVGADTFVLDDGWFGKRDSDASGLGDWKVNKTKLPGGLKPIIDRCKSKGLGFGLWFEPEMVSEDSDLYRAHPDWAIHCKDIPLCYSRNQFVLDFTRKEVVDHVFDAVSAVLRENDISYVKWDMNRNITENYSEHLGSNGQGEFMHRYILGVYDLAERLTAAFPNILMEGCSGGGGRFDCGMLYYFPQIWVSDNTDPVERAKIQYGTSACYPLSSLSCHVSATGRDLPLRVRAAIASLGVFGYELDLSKASEEYVSEARAATKEYRELSELVLKGDLYRLSDPFVSDFAEIVVSKDKTQAYFVLQKMHMRLPVQKTKTIRLLGLDPQKTYHIRELELTAKGETLINMGVRLPHIWEYYAVTWHIHEVKG